MSRFIREVEDALVRDHHSSGKLWPDEMKIVHEDSNAGYSAAMVAADIVNYRNGRIS